MFDNLERLPAAWYKRAVALRDDAALPRRPRRQPPAPAGAAAGARGARRRAASTTPGCAAAEDEAIRDVVRMQEEVGLRAATDGEFRRASWHMDFIYQLDGIDEGGRRTSRSGSSTRRATIEFTPAALHVNGEARRLARRSSATTSASSQETVTRNVPKLTIPSPSMVHYRGGRAAIDESLYPDLDAFWADLTAAYREQVRRLGELGCRYLQFDDTSLAYLNDPHQRELRRLDRRRPRAPARRVHPPHQRGALRRGPREWPSRPTCAAATSAPPGRRRAATTSSPRRSSTSSTSTASSWSGTTSARAASSRSASCRRARSSCSGS